MAASLNAVSAPGKVLLAGGYLVLDRAHSGLVFGLDARVHVIVQSKEGGADNEARSRISVSSPQFRDTTWTFEHNAATADGGGIQVTQLKTSSPSDSHPNPFVESALSHALTYLANADVAINKPLSITILADNDYYSQRARDDSSRSNARFAKFDLPLWDAHKTGLGSSAALVTSLLAALLRHYLPKEKFSLSDRQALNRLHNLAQVAHCAAQGKVGSGFDVASAVYGSCIYRRFSPEVVDLDGGPGSAGFAQKLSALIDDTSAEGRWDTDIKKSAIDIPMGLRLVMIDVDCGSETPSMVKKVLAWRSQNPDEANSVWTMLQRYNQALSTELLRLSRTVRTDYSALRLCIADMRFWIRTMGRLSGVPIEPDSQTDLIDACSAMRGVIGGVVPGAGGYDAVALLIEDKAEIEEKLRDFLQNWKVPRVTDGKRAGEGRARLLGVSGEMGGAKEEKPDQYKEWLS